MLSGMTICKSLISPKAMPADALVTKLASSIDNDFFDV